MYATLRAGFFFYHFSCRRVQNAARYHDDGDLHRQDVCALGELLRDLLAVGLHEGVASLDFSSLYASLATDGAADAGLGPGRGPELAPLFRELLGAREVAVTAGQSSLAAAMKLLVHATLGGLGDHSPTGRWRGWGWG